MNTLTANLQQAPRRIHVILGVVLMLLCVVLAEQLKPTRLWAETRALPDLEAMVPKQFGDWTQAQFGANSVVNPQQQESLANTYTSTLARIYVHKPSGRAIMLSLAYGKDQSRDTQLHRPEMCYRSQGFRVDSVFPADLALTGNSTLQTTRMLTSLGPRQEPATYLIRIADSNIRGSMQMNLVRMQFAMQGYIADGMLFRVSEATRTPPKDAFVLQDRFIADLLVNLTPLARDQIVGSRVF
jgi:EpsI family protein